MNAVILAGIITLFCIVGATLVQVIGNRDNKTKTH